jgi:hypothetical protein
MSTKNKKEGEKAVREKIERIKHAIEKEEFAFFDLTDISHKYKPCPLGCREGCSSGCKPSCYEGKK